MQFIHPCRLTILLYTRLFVLATTTVFCNEGEASLHFCLQKGIDDCHIQTGKGILVIDAGGGTIDMSAYTPVSHTGHLSFSEIATPRCQFNGSVFVSHLARKALSNKLTSSEFAKDVDEIADCFDRTTKLNLRSNADPAFIKFGRLRDNDPSVGIKNGQMKLTGDEVASFFSPSIRSIIKAANAISSHASESISSVFLVGGFAASEWLYRSLCQHFKPLGIEVFRPDTHVNKAVSDGAVGYHIDHQVSVRVSRYHYGTRCDTFFIREIADHAKRESKKYRDCDGTMLLPNFFDIILRKNVKIHETEEFRCYYYLPMTYRPSPDWNIPTDILQYCGTNDNPQWTDDEPGSFLTLCSVRMDGHSAAGLVRESVNPQGQKTYTIQYEVVLKFGLTELEAQIAWKENGVEKRGPAKIIYAKDEPTIASSKLEEHESYDE